MTFAGLGALTLWLTQTPLVSACTTTDGRRVTLEAISTGSPHEHLPGPRWHAMAAAILPASELGRYKLTPLLLVDGPCTADMYILRLPPGVAGIEVIGIGPAGEELQMTSRTQTAWYDGDYLMVEFEKQVVRELRLATYLPDGSRETIGQLPVPDAS